MMPSLLSLASLNSMIQSLQPFSCIGNLARLFLTKYIYILSFFFPLALLLSLVFLTELLPSTSKPMPELKDDSS